MTWHYQMTKWHNRIANWNFQITEWHIAHPSTLRFDHCFPVGTNLSGMFSEHSIFVLFRYLGFGIKCPSWNIPRMLQEHSIRFYRLEPFQNVPRMFRNCSKRNVYIFGAKIRPCQREMPPLWRQNGSFYSNSHLFSFRSECEKRSSDDSCVACRSENGVYVFVIR